MRYLMAGAAVLTLLASVAVDAFGEDSGTLKLAVNAEEDVYTLVSPDNGSGPFWCYGCTQIVRLGDDVIVSQMETGEGVPLLCNTRWRLLLRGAEGWSLVAEADAYRQREPCPVAIASGDFFLYANDSTQPPGTRYGPCKPHLTGFSLSSGEVVRRTLMPSWRGEPYFTDHSYRGFGADQAAGQLLMLNIDAKTSVQHACLLSTAGETLATGSITFPVRACYPQVALRGGAVHVLAISDVVEPVEAWRTYKFEQTGNKWDYVFRILYYSSTPDLKHEGFAEPLEVANVDDTGGYINNQDLWLSPAGDAYILYTEREVQSALLRDKFFPEKSIVSSLHLAVVRNGAVVSRRTLVAGTEERTPGCARFQEAADGILYAVVYIGGEGAGNVLVQVFPEPETPALVPIPLTKPMSAFCLASVRAGCAPADTIDLLGQTSADTVSYAQVTLE